MVDRNIIRDDQINQNIDDQIDQICTGNKFTSPVNGFSKLGCVEITY